MNDNRTQKAKDQEWLRDVVRRALTLHDDYDESMEGIFCYMSHDTGVMTGNASPSFQMSVALKLIKSFQDQTRVPTSDITEFIAYNLNEA